MTAEKTEIKYRLVRNDKPRPMILPVEFSSSFCGDLDNMTAREYIDGRAKFEDSMAEGWMRRQAEKEPDGYYAKTFFDKVPINENAEFIETMISNCGTATGLAELASKLLSEARRLEYCRLNIWDAYQSLRTVVLLYAGVSETEFSQEDIDEAIAKF